MPRSWLDRNALAVGGAAAGIAVGAMLWPRRAASAAAVNSPPLAIHPATAPRPATSHTTTPTVTMPTLPAVAPAEITAGMSALDYDRAVVAAAIEGRVPASQGFVPVTVTSPGHTGTFWASMLPLTIGTDEAPFRAPLSAPSAQRIADRFGYLLPTRKMVDAIHAQANVRVPFRAYASARQSVGTYLASSDAITQRIAGRKGLVSDYAKDYVITNARRSNPAKIAIYGAWDSHGAIVQPFSVPHAITYFDYSQQPRFVLNRAIVDGREMALVDALADATTAPLFSSEGPIVGAMLRY